MKGRLLTGFLFRKSSDNYSSIDCACHCEVVSTVAISLEKTRLLRFTRNDISHSWIWVSIVLSLSMMICLCGLIAPAHAQQCVAIQSSTPDVWLYGCESRLTTNPADQYDPAISGDLVVYTDARAGNKDVWYYDIGAGQEVQVTNALGDQKLSDVSNGSVVYVDLPTSDVVLYSAVTGSTTNLTASANSVSLYPAIGDGTVAWVDDRTGEKEVFARSLATGEERRVTDSPLPDDLPAVSAGLIVWQRCEGGRCEIFSYNWATETTRQLTQTSGSDERHPDISGNGVVYDGERDGDVRDIFFYDLSSGTEKRLALAGYQENPNISGDYVAFEDYSSGPAHIKLWHVPSNSVFQVTTGPGQQYLNDIDGNRIVYTHTPNRGIERNRVRGCSEIRGAAGHSRVKDNI